MHYLPNQLSLRRRRLLRSPQAPAMVGTRKRREPLVLASTRSLLDSVLGHTPVAAPSLVRLPAGLLRLADGRASELGVDGSISVGVSVSVLKRLSTSSGSLVAFFTLFKELDGGLMWINLFLNWNRCFVYVYMITWCSYVNQSIWIGTEMITWFNTFHRGIVCICIVLMDWVGLFR